MSSILPWHQAVWEYLMARKQAQTLPHALLLQGKNGLGKYLLARRFGELLLCQDNVGDADVACARCTACLLLQADNHPKMLMIQAKEEGRAIRIEQIRELSEKLGTTSHIDGYYIVIIKGAELMNTQAANALLKTLEEPPAQTIIMLITEHPALLPLTIRSRCQMLGVDTPSRVVAREWLEQDLGGAILGLDIDLALALAGGAPLAARVLLTDGLATYHDFCCGIYELRQEKMSLREVVDKCMVWGADDVVLKFMYVVSDLLKIKLGITDILLNYKHIENLSLVAMRIGWYELFAYQEWLCKVRGFILNRIAINQQLLIENLLITWMKL